jgi:hypothetical protein
LVAGIEIPFSNRKSGEVDQYKIAQDAQNLPAFTGLMAGALPGAGALFAV